MWFENSYRRHLCDMHIDDWNDEFLSEFSPEEYFNNLKKAKIQNAMIYFQSHVGLCHYPTKSGKMHNSFIGKEDAIKKLVDMCRNNGISVTGYYSLIYNNWAHDTHKEWRMVNKDGLSLVESNGSVSDTAFASKDTFRYGMCCPNNSEYRKFVKEQIKEMAEYFTVDGMFFDMLFWPQVCYCDSCKKRFKEEYGLEIPEKEDWNDPAWQKLMEARRRWMGEFSKMAEDYAKSFAPISVEHNVAFAALPDATKGLAKEVLDTTDYAGGDLYGGIYAQSFTCKFYKNITKNQPFEYMFSRCTPGLSYHTVTKSKDEMLSALALTSAHHGATLVIDAIDPCGTMDSRVYERLGEVFESVIPFEEYYKGNMIEDIGLYYSLKSKFNANNENFTNHSSCVNAMKTFVYNNISCGITNETHNLDGYKMIMAPSLTEVDKPDFDRIIDYVKNGGNLYISGGDCVSLINEFFGAKVTGRTKEKVVYIAPKSSTQSPFEYFNEKYPMHFGGTAPVTEGFSDDAVIAHITLPYTNQDIAKFASIHSNPPGIKTDIPAMAFTAYGKGKVLWSGLNIEDCDMYDYRRILINLINNYFDIDYTIKSDAPKDVEITAFNDDTSILVNTVLLNEDYKARQVEDYSIGIRCDNAPKSVVILPDEKPVEFKYENGFTKFDSQNKNIFNMYKIIL